MLKGQLFATSDINLVNQAISQGFKIIYLGDPISIDQYYKDKFVVASALVPDYNTMAMQVDGNEQGFMQMYMAALNSKAAIEMLAIIFVCLYKGMGIVFYVPQEAAGLNYAQYLLNFLEYNYGICAQTKSTQFSFNPVFTSKVVELMYLNNLITAQEFLVHSDTLDDIVLLKLVEELHPMVEDPTKLENIIGWFSNYKKELLSTGKPLINGVQYAGEDRDYAINRRL